MAGIYIHIPFCNSFCTYCDFYSEQKREKMRAFTDALCHEIALRHPLPPATSFHPDTLYFGGGTPSTLPVPYLEEILQTIHSFYGDTFEEQTIEVNPDDINLPYLEQLKRLGFNRISMGVQSFNDNHLRWMNRRHTAAQAISAFSMMREVGFDNISLDLIFGYASLTTEELASDLKQLTTLSPEHISTYQLTLESGSTLAATSYKELSPDICAEQYSLIQSTLCESGYSQYEVSNFSKPGFQSRHNSAYWEREPYIGYGPAAHSFLGSRSWNIPDLEQYIDAMSQNNISLCSSEEILTEKECAEEILMLGLRRTKGLSLSKLPKRFRESKTFCKSLQKMIAPEGDTPLIIAEGETIRIPKEKLFISDYIILELI